MQINILIFNGFDEMDAIAPFEVLQNAVAAGAPFDVKLVVSDNAEMVTGSHGLQVKAQGQIGKDSPMDILIVPGGNWNNPMARGVRTEVEQGDIPLLIDHLHHAGVLIAGVCTGAMLMAEANILRGRNTVTHHLANPALQEKGTTIVPARVVDDGDIITSGGVTSGLDLALWLVERFAGSQIAHNVEQRMEYERRGTVWRSA